VTFDDWDACVASGGCVQASDANWGRGSRPVINVSWYDAKQYVAWTSKLTGKSYRLLTEAEWEYAVRAQTAITAESTLYSFGNDEAKLGDYAWYVRNSGGKGTQEVGKKLPNAFGLYDMHGNVLEWVEDCYVEYYRGAPTDGTAMTKADCSEHVRRGGSWIGDPIQLRSATRERAITDLRRSDVGFRVARTFLTP